MQIKGGMEFSQGGVVGRTLSEVVLHLGKSPVAKLLMMLDCVTYVTPLRQSVVGAVIHSDSAWRCSI